MNKITPINLEDESAEHCSIKQAAHHSALTPNSFAESAKGKTGFYRIIKAAGYSMDGFKAAYKFEAAFRQVVWLNVVLLAAVIMMPFTLGIKMTLVLASFLSLIVELINTGIEACVDHTSTAKHPLAKIAKDVGSAAQFVSLCLLTILWLMALSVFL
ncbi:diacylglycerol kinase [Psychrobacter sp. C 20.9]|uniref:diacylglycerol kinase n=1 Tax=Psychrobacter sp. C 20.9 TaxID=1926477 RepID=UPI0009FA58FA|nr:diacylglycerol kinase [Psychrobacter sp. C 20.9]